MSRTFGHPLMFVLGKQWPKIYTENITPHLSDLDLELVGGLADRGWTIHDIDIIGNIKEVPKFIERIRKAKIKNPVHFCDMGYKKHSHLRVIVNGLKSLFMGDKWISHDH